MAEAVACYHRALHLKPDYPEAHNNLGIALMELGRLDEALTSFDAAIAIRPQPATPISNSDSGSEVDRPSSATDAPSARPPRSGSRSS